MTCRALLHMSFLSPVIVLVLWVKPIARDFLANAPMGKTSITLWVHVSERGSVSKWSTVWLQSQSSCRVPSAAFDSLRLWVIVALCTLRLLLTRYHLQAYLNLAPKWVEQMKKEAGRIAAIDIQRKVGAEGELKWAQSCLVEVFLDQTPLNCFVQRINTLCVQVTRIFCYLTVITLQYLVPIFLILFSTLALKALGKSTISTHLIPIGF